MPLSSKRSQRARKETLNNNVDVPDSSPSRPAKRRKKVSSKCHIFGSQMLISEKTEEPAEKPAPEPARLPFDRAGLEMGDEALISAVVPTLQMPQHFVQASQDHANALYEKHNKEGVQAYAKLAGKDWTFYVKNLSNIIGRPPEGANPQPGQKDSPRVDASGARLPIEPSEHDVVHIDLGPSKMVSRLHAEIYFDSDSERWNILVQGRNGIRLNFGTLRRGDRHALVSGEVIEIGGVEMMFVLPQEEGSLQVDRKYLERAGLIQTADDDDTQDHDTDAPTSSAAPSGQPRGQNGSGPLPIAPAPPDYRRPGTPVSARTKAPYSVGKSPGFAGGTMLMNADDVDLSLDSNQHIKPSYSYAQMISQAILDTEDEKLNLSGIYSYIMDKYAYYRHQLGGGWQNSIRHNLSLNKAFHKVARSTDEPGKGMKWCIVPEVRDEMAKNCVRGGRGGHRGSSAPGSPANLGYLTRASKDAGEPSSASRTKRSRSGSPPPSSYPANVPQFTPDRGGTSSMPDFPGDGSPLPRHRRSHNNAFGLSDNVPGSPPVLSSSYLQEDNNSLVTPAPHRVHPRLAPPSTAQRPSQHMPTSSPAPFWKYADIGNTPMKGPAFDLSPIKAGASIIPPSSSPPPARRSSAASPSRNVVAVKAEEPAVEEPEEEEQGFDLTRGFQSIGSYHAPIGNGVQVAPSVDGRS
ncbi:hypothetical protein G7Y89_g6013 [Cudoniella acicularis]|uniref:Uncharacterized protein n=1 Tax=Cudoniella acicularis TaxID=354080 RepID=A0A8H4W563_9HELO|nr:hypothetical protein G7Y89_g6013 [Cudoniella acicularis]